MIMIVHQAVGMNIAMNTAIGFVLELPETARGLTQSEKTFCLAFSREVT